MEKEVYIVVLTWNQKEITLKFLENIKKVKYPNYKIILIDNGSTDGTYNAIQGYSNLIYIYLPFNIGCAGGRNIGINYFLSRTKGDYLAFLDNDIEVEEDFIDKALKAFEKEKNLGIVGGIIYYGRSKKIQWAGSKINWWKGIFESFTSGEFKEREIDNVMGAIIFAKREVYEKVPEIDESYFIYHEDPDWCLSVKKKGYKILFLPQLKFYHHCSSSLGMESPLFYYYRTRNRLKFFFKNSQKSKFILFFLYFLLWDFPFYTLLTLYLNNKYKQLKAAILGVFDFLRGRFGKRNLSREFLETPVLIFLSRKLDKVLELKISRLFRYIRYFLKKIFRKKLKIMVISSWRLGDEITFLPVYENIKRKFKNSQIDVVCNYPELLCGYEFLNVVKRTDSKKYDLIIDLRGEDPLLTRRENLEKKIKMKIEEYPKLKVRKDKVENVIGISTGAGWECRKWPIKYFEELSEYIEKKGFEVWIFGLPDEKISKGKDFTGRSLKDCIENLKKCRIFIGNDSGLLHLALSLNIPSIGLFGPTFPQKMYGDNPLLYPIVSNVKCQGCWNRRFMKYPGICPYGIPECMEKIKVEDVIKVVDKILNKEFKK